MNWRNPSHNVPDLCFVVSMRLAQRAFPRKRVQHREEVRILASPNSCSWERVNDMRAEFMFLVQVHMFRIKDTANLRASVYSIICLKSPFTSETDVPWCSSHVLIHWSSLVLQDLKKELVGLEGLRDSLKPRYNGGVVVLSCRSR